MKKKSKDYLEGFKHGAEWVKIYYHLSLKGLDFEIKDGIKRAIESLKEGR